MLINIYIAFPVKAGIKLFPVVLCLQRKKIYILIFAKLLKYTICTERVERHAVSPREQQVAAGKRNKSNTAAKDLENGNASISGNIARLEQARRCILFPNTQQGIM